MKENMAVQPILKMGTPSLMQKSTSWPEDQFSSPALFELLHDMHDSMIAAKGAGLAAPQIGRNVRVVIFEVKENPRYPGVSVPYTVLINPTVSAQSERTEEGWEGCLSVPGMRGLVTRAAEVRYTGFDERGNKIDRTVDGFHARVVQHEFDHLDGILYPMRMTDMSKFGYTEILFPNLDPDSDD